MTVAATCVTVRYRKSHERLIEEVAPVSSILDDCEYQPASNPDDEDSLADVLPVLRIRIRAGEVRRQRRFKKL